MRTIETGASRASLEAQSIRSLSKEGDAVACPAATPSGSRIARILFVSMTFPSDLTKSVNGIFQRLRIFLDAAASITDRLDLLFFIDPSFVGRLDARRFTDELREQWGVDAVVHFAEREESHRSRFDQNLRPLWQFSSHASFFKTGGVAQRRAVEALIDESTSLIFAFQLESILPVLAVRDVTVPIAFDMNDVEHVKYPRMLSRLPNGLNKALQYCYWPALYLGERHALRRSSMAFVCSEFAVGQVGRMTPGSRIRVAPNAVTFARTLANIPIRGSSASTRLLFVGMYGYAPNLEGAEFLARRIFPLVRMRVPEATLVFVGPYIEKIAHLAGPGIELKGFVDDLAAEYESSAIACCPILAGGGTRTKILEAAAHRVPIVATTLGAEGIDFRDGVEIVLRDQPAAFATACIELLADPAGRTRISDAAYERARIYDRDRVVLQVANDLRVAADATRESSACG